MRKIVNSTLLLPCLALAISFTACDQSKQLKEMHDSTGEMKDSTNSMKNDMSGMKNDMGGMLDYTSGLCRGSRQSFAMQAREELLTQLLQKTVQPADKVSEAGKYMMAFEYQAWMVCGGSDSDVEMDVLKEAATIEFFKSITKFNTGGNVRPLIPKGSADDNGMKKDNLDLTFNALAAALSQVNPFQQLRNEKNPCYKTVSMYDLIVDALKKEKDVNSGKIKWADLKQYDKDVLNDRDVAIRLLQARQNFLGGVVLSKAVETADRSIGNVANMAENKFLHSGKPWTFNFDTWNVVQIKENTQYLVWANDTRKFLLSIGEAIYMDPELQAHLTGLREKTRLQASVATGDARSDFNRQLEAYTAGQTAPTSSLENQAQCAVKDQNLQPSAGAK